MPEWLRMLLSEEWIRLTISAAGGGAVTLIATWLRTRATTKTAEIEHAQGVDVALVVRDQTIADTLIGRIKDLDHRCDVLSDEIARVRAEAAECHRNHADCQRETRELEERVVEAEALVEKMRDQIERVEIRLTSTPPGAWQVDEEEMIRLAAERHGREG